jgi:hypothetical protein
MKKFSKVTGVKVNEEPKVETKIDEVDELKLEMLTLMDNFLKVRASGPIHNTLLNGSLSVEGKDLLAEAIITLLSEKTNKDKTKVLESLKTKISDWQTIDEEIEKINQKRPSINNVNRINKLIEKYSSDEDTLVFYVESTVSKLKSVDTLGQYSKLISESNLSDKTKNQIVGIYNNRIKQISSIL